MDRPNDSLSGACDLRENGESDSREGAAQRLVHLLPLAPADLHRDSVAVFLANMDAPVAGDWARALLALVARMRRLEQLECEFDQTLLREKLASMRELAYG